jgi:hypothetical protein
MLVHVKGCNSQGDVVLELGSEPLLNDVIAALEKRANYDQPKRNDLAND